MAGDVSCEWAPWWRANYYFQNVSNFDRATWQIAHTMLLRELRIKKEAPGVLVRVEQQNSFRFELSSGAVISGVPDLVVTDGDEVTVYDAKTGQPRLSDRIQVMLYMHFLPLARPELLGKRIAGAIKYKDHEVPIPLDSIVGEFEEQIDYFLAIVTQASPPVRTPSERECGWCNIGPADCPDRIERSPEAVADLRPPS